MESRSPELRNILLKSIKPDAITKEYEQAAFPSYVDRERKEQLARNLEQEQTRITAFEEKFQMLLEQYGEMPDAEFDRLYDEAENELEVIKNRLLRYEEAYEAERPYTVEFVEINKVESLDAFIEQRPMYFVPRKQEIGRMLALAKGMHDERIYRGETTHTTPITIVDIGGANGALGKLMVDLAKQNGLKIEYTVVDPDRPSIDKAAAFYAKDPSLKFVAQDGGTFNKELHHDSPMLVELMNQREELIRDGDQKHEDLRKVLMEIQEVFRRGELDADMIRAYLKIFKDNFEINLPADLAEDVEKFNEVLLGDYSVRPSKTFMDVHLSSWGQLVDELTRQIGQELQRQPSKFDLVINSWMPVRLDLTKEIQEASGAAILYAVERFGATGCRSDAPYVEYPEHLGQGESYNPGPQYQSQVGWVSHSVPQIHYMKINRKETYWDYMDSRVPAFANAFLTQTRKDYGVQIYGLDPGSAGIVTEGAYPWETELAEKGGEVSPFIRLTDNDGKLDYFKPIGQLCDELEEYEEGKLGSDQRSSSVASF